MVGGWKTSYVLHTSNLFLLEIFSKHWLKFFLTTILRVVDTKYTNVHYIKTYFLITIAQLCYFQSLLARYVQKIVYHNVLFSFLADRRKSSIKLVFPKFFELGEHLLIKLKWFLKLPKQISLPKRLFKLMFLGALVAP